MPAERARATWTDERLDDLARRIEHGFDRVDRDMKTGFARMEARIDAQGESIKAINGRIDAQGESINARIDALQRTMLAMMASILAGFAALVLIQL